MSDSPFIYEITAENFEQIVVNGSFEVPILVDFWADWCQPCKLLMPVLAKLAEEYNGKFILAKVNTEQQQAVAMQFGIRSIPTVKLFIQGQEVDEFAGALPESEVRAFLDKHLPRESDNVVLAAEQHLLEGDPAAALALLSPAQAADPANHRILLAMARANVALNDFTAARFALDALPADQQDNREVALLRGQMDFAEQAPAAEQVPQLQARLEADENDSEALYKLAMAAVLQQDVTLAIDLLLALMTRDRDYGDDAARQALLKLFDMLGDDPLAAQARRRMFNLMH
jgi:putative thioredoxin